MMIMVGLMAAWSSAAYESIEGEQLIGGLSCNSCKMSYQCPGYYSAPGEYWRCSDTYGDRYANCIAGHTGSCGLINGMPCGDSEGCQNYKSPESGSTDCN